MEPNRALHRPLLCRAPRPLSPGRNFTIPPLRPLPAGCSSGNEMGGRAGGGTTEAAFGFGGCVLASCCGLRCKRPIMGAEAAGTAPPCFFWAAVSVASTCKAIFPSSDVTAYCRASLRNTTMRVRTAPLVPPISTRTDVTPFLFTSIGSGCGFGTVPGSSITKRSGFASRVTRGVTGEVRSASTFTPPFSSATVTPCRMAELSLCALALAANNNIKNSFLNFTVLHRGS